MSTLSATSDIVERLATHRTLSAVPRAELEWLAAHGVMRHYDAGQRLAETGAPPTELIVLFTGRIGVHLQSGTGHRHLVEFVAGDVSGVLPYSRITTSMADVFAGEATDALVLHRDCFHDLVRECPEATAIMVHTMVDRARTFASANWQDEKMASLGRLAAGLAHELNNPASATVRSAKLLSEALAALEQASIALGALGLTEPQLAAITAWRDAALVPATTGVFSTMERVDREDALSEWLGAHGADLDSAPALLDGGLTESHLDELAQAVPPTALNAALAWIAAARTARSLSGDIERAGGRIYDLVASVKRFSHMDRGTATEQTNIAQSLADTVSVLSGKAKQREVAVRLDVADDLPLVPAYAAELNQVWSNLIDNALDAVSRGGQVRVQAAQEGANVVVRVIDNGPGIPADVRSRIFDPFFTTKGVGEGSGLGLDIARRVVRLHNGEITVDSREGHTEFSVAIPIEVQPNLVTPASRDLS
jgi:signal transduction histidine kinase